jgi:hypothetical protein
MDRQRAEAYLKEAAELCEREGGRTWGVTLCGPVLIVDAATRTVIANQPAPAATLPPLLPVANAAVDWNGTRWTMLTWQLLPPPQDRPGRLRIVAHELYHRIQPQLGFTPPDGKVDHLETVESRYWMQMEWRALARALRSAASPPDMRQPLADAMAFRAARRKLYPGGVEGERALEMNEGLANYTGVIASTSNRQEAIAGAIEQLDIGARRDSFTRWFAYASGPAYGLLLDELSPGWRESLKLTTDLGDLLMNAAKIHPSNADAAAKNYGGAEVLAAERKRDEEYRARVDAYRKRLVDGNIVVFTAGPKTRRSFSAIGMTVIPGAGTVYTNMRVPDEWGILEVINGAVLLGPGKYVLPGPARVDAGKLSGDGWAATLEEGWTLAPGSRAGESVVIRKQ